MSFMAKLLLVAAAVPILFAVEIPRSDLEAEANLRREMIAHDRNYLKLSREREVRLGTLDREVLAREARGQKTTCSRQIVTETGWLIDSTADFAHIDRRLGDLKATLADPTREAIAEEQDTDGSWGRCSTEWFFKLDSSFDHLSSSTDRAAKYSYAFLDRVNSPENLKRYFNSVFVSDIVRTGIDHRREFNESLSDLIRLILHDLPAGYRWHPGLKAAFRDLILNRLRNPATGFWGATFVRNGTTAFVDDLSMTYHVVAYLKGDVPDLARLVNTLLAFKNLDYPVGWLRRGRYSNHHNMDVAVLLRYGWPSLSDTQKQEAAGEIRKMLRWCLSESLQSDGSFRIEPGQDSVEEQIYFPVAFLARVGYFDKSRRFWTDEDFPEAEGIRQRILAYIERHRASGGAGGGYYQSAMDELRSRGTG